MRKFLAFVLSAVMLLGAFSGGVFAEGKSDVPAPITPIVLTVARDYIVLAPIVGYEYRLGDDEWQESNLFTGLLPLTEYVFYQRVAETDTENASESSEGTKAVTDKPVAEAPEAPTVREYDAQRVYLAYTYGYEYRVDDGEWQKTPSFPANFGEPHRYYQRVAESDQNYASESSEALVYELEKLERPEMNIDNVLGDINAWDYVTCDFYDGYCWSYGSGETEMSSYQFSLDCVEWRDSPKFGGLKPGTEYTLYVRWAPSIKYHPTEGVELKKFTTKTFAQCDGTEDCLSVIGMSDTMVEIKGKYNDMSYILVDTDGNPVTEWQNSGVFTGLQPDTEYRVYCSYWYYNYYDNYLIYTKSLPVRTLKTGEKYYRNIGNVKITGDNKTVGSTLNVDLSTIEIPEGATVTVQWYRYNKEISGATGLKYTTTKDDVAARIQAVVTVEAEVIDFYGRATSEGFDMEAYLLGDVNGDFKINLSDASMTLKHIARWDISGFNKKAANMNGDTTVNLVDVARILKKIAGWKK